MNSFEVLILLELFTMRKFGKVDNKILRDFRSIVINHISQSSGYVSFMHNLTIKSFIDSRKKNKGDIAMSPIENHFKNVPDYYDWMYLDGYTPEEIMYAFHRKMDREQAEREALEEGFDSIKVKSEVKLKK